MTLNTLNELIKWVFSQMSKKTDKIEIIKKSHIFHAKNFSYERYDFILEKSNN